MARGREGKGRGAGWRLGVTVEVGGRDAGKKGGGDQGKAREVGRLCIRKEVCGALASDAAGGSQSSCAHHKYTS